LRHEQSAKTAEDRECQCLGGELPHQSPAARAKRASHCQLGSPFCIAAKQEVDDVHAGDQQQHRGGGEHRERCRPGFPRQIGVQRLDEQAGRHGGPDRPRESRHGLSRDAIDLGRRGLMRDTSFQPRNHPEVMPPFAALE
jgi:hypothetical protein